MCACKLRQCDRIWEKGPLCAKCKNFSNSPFQGLKNPKLPTWFVGRLAYGKASVPSSEPPKWGIKQRFSNAINVAVGNGQGLEFLASVAGWKNVHAKVEVRSCYGSRDISIFKWKFGNGAKWSLFSDPVTYCDHVPHTTLTATVKPKISRDKYFLILPNSAQKQIFADKIFVVYLMNLKFLTWH